jgi:ATP-dependent helicase/DNAse subunit B
MKGKVFLVPFGTQNTTEFLFKKAIAKIADNDYSEIVYIGPTAQKIYDAQETFFRLVNKIAYRPPQCYTIKQYVLEVFYTFSPSTRVFPDYLKPLLIQKLSPDNFSIGYARVLADFIREVKQYLPGKSPEDLKDLIDKKLKDRKFFYSSENVEKLFQALEIYRKYNEALKEHNFKDTEDVLSVGAQLINDQVTIKTLILDGSFYDLTTLEEQIIAALINKAQEVYALSFYDSRNPQAYALPQEFLLFLRSLNLLEEEYLPSQFEIRTNIPHYVCSSIEEEVDFIAWQIKSQALEKRLIPEKTIVTFSRLPEYERLVTRTFNKYKIPYTIISGKKLSITQPVVALLELLNAIANDFPRLSVISVITSPYFQFFSSGLKSQIDHISKKAKLIKGREHWQKVCVTYHEILKDERKSASVLKLKELQREINEFLNLAVRMIENSENKEEGLSNYARKLKTLLIKLKWCQEFKESDETVEIRTRVYELLDALQKFELEFGKHPISFMSFQKILKYYLDQTEITPPSNRQGVLVLSFIDTRGLDCDYLFFGGLSEEKFPGHYHPQPIFPEWLKEELKLPSLKRHLVRTRFHFFRLTNTARVKTVLTYYNTAGDKLLLPSPFLSDEALPLPLKPAIYSDDEYQIYLGSQAQYELKSFFSIPDFRNDKEAQELIAHKYYNRIRKCLVYSVTDLDKYARCNYQYYLENVLAVSHIREPEVAPEATFWGDIVHETLKRLYERQTPELDNLEKELEKALESVLEEKKVSSFWRDVIRRILKEFTGSFLKLEKELRDDNYVPKEVEVLLSAAIDDDVIVRGKIDRLDLADDKKAMILDYKTGNIESLRNSIQLPIYGYLVKKQFGYQISRMGFYSIPEEKIDWYKVKPKDSKCALDAAINSAVIRARQLITNIRAGYFGNKTEGHCYTCFYSPLCPLKLNSNNGDQSAEDVDSE